MSCAVQYHNCSIAYHFLVVVLAENSKIQDKLRQHDIHIQTVHEAAPIEVQPARVLSHLYAYLGRNKKLNLSGRQSKDVGLLSTSKLYSLHDRIFAFTPQVRLSSCHQVLTSHSTPRANILYSFSNFPNFYYKLTILSSSLMDRDILHQI